jgi:hypothetical protein
MKKILLISFAVVAVIAGVAFTANIKNTEVFANKTKKTATVFLPIAVIELFTSQGCSSCPSADHLLERTITHAKKEGKNIFALSFHVDYWNRLGWADPFSAKLYSQRQNAYASVMQLNSVYTPQMIVNGTKEFVGSDESSLKNALAKSLNTTPDAAFTTLVANVENSAAPSVKFSVAGNYIGSKINFALVSLSETTSIKRGENGGLTLTNENVVRQFITIDAKADGEISFKNMPLPAKNNMAIVAYIQNNTDLKIIGAAMAELQ